MRSKQPFKVSKFFEYVIDVSLIGLLSILTCWTTCKFWPSCCMRRGLRLGDEEALQWQAERPDERSSLLRGKRVEGEGGAGGRGDVGSAATTTSLPIRPSRPTTTASKIGQVHMRTLDPSLLPVYHANSTADASHRRRLIMIGDVHGCKASLDALLEKVSFAPENDHLVFTGDIINKGPDSAGVVDLAMKYGATGVRGNHEDRILRLREELGMADAEEDGESTDEVSDGDGVETPGEDEDEDGSDEEAGALDKEENDKEKMKDKRKKEKKGKKKEKKEKKKEKKEKKEKKKDKDKDKDKKATKEDKNDKNDKNGKKDKKDKVSKKGKKKDKSGKEAREISLAKSLTPSQVHYLKSLPIILKLGIVQGMGMVVVVHGGIVPGIELENQDDWNVMNMRSIDQKKGEVLDTPKGEMWAHLYNNYQSKLVEIESDPENHKRMTVVYGHDARTSLAIKEYTKGLDSGCVKGEKLTALVVAGGGKQSLVQVKCQDEVEE